MNRAWGAKAEDWGHFDLVLGLTSDLLPVVSNPAARISKLSNMKGVGKTPSRYTASREVIGFTGWTQHVATHVEVASWAREPDYGICLQTRVVRAIDVDVTDAAQAASVRKLIDSRVCLPARVRANSSKFLLVFMLAGEHPKRKIKVEHGIIEMLGNGQQFVACGTHTSGMRYEWEGGLPDSIPEITREQFEALWLELVEQFAIEDSDTERKTSVRQQKLTGAVSNDPVAQHLIDKDMVLKIEKDQRMHITCPWEAEHTTDTGESSTTYFPAHTNGYQQGHAVCLHAHCENRTDAEFKAAIGYVDADVLADFEVLAGEVDIDSTEKSISTLRFQPTQCAEFAQLVATEWIIKGVLPRAELGIVFGESGSGKTFKVLDLAMAVATGVEWRQRAVHQGAVVYVAAEGTGGFKKRLRAHAQHHGLDLAGVPLYVIPAAPNLLQKADALDVCRAVNSLGVKTSLVIIDTLAQTTAGGNENSGEDMGLALSHCKGIHKATGAMVLLVHHSGKDTSKGARGWSGLRAACDVELEVTRFDQERVLALTKQKDGDDMLEFGFKLTTISLGFDADGDEITSCVAEPTDAAVQRKARGTGKKLGHNERLVLRTMGEMMAGEGEGAQVGALIERVTAQMLPPDEGKKDRRREMAHRAIQALQDAEKVCLNDRGELFVMGEE